MNIPFSIPKPIAFILTIGNLAGILYLFARALANPVQYHDFIFGVSIPIFFLEFLAIHSTAMFAPGGTKYVNGRAVKEWSLANKLSLIILYIVFAAAISLFSKNYIIIIVFVLSLLAKAFGSLANIATNRLIITIAIFMGTTFLVIWGSPVITHFFVLGLDVMQYKPVGQSGLAVDAPQVLLIWGVIYFSASLIAELVLYLRNSYTLTK